MRAAVPAARVVIFTAYVEAAVLRLCLAAGVAGVLIKDADELELVGDLRRIRSGDLVIDSRVQATFEAGDLSGLEGSLTPREMQVLGLLAEGMSSKEIAVTLGIAPNTVRSYSQAVLFKLDATTRIQALARARAHGLL
jgi:DNA-binding NarL/FixJ family response regulator